MGTLGEDFQMETKLSRGNSKNMLSRNLRENHAITKIPDRCIKQITAKR